MKLETERTLMINKTSYHQRKSFGPSAINPLPLHCICCDNQMLSIGIAQPCFDLLGQAAALGDHCAFRSLQGGADCLMVILL